MTPQKTFEVTTASHAAGFPKELVQQMPPRVLAIKKARGPKQPWKIKKVAGKE